MLPTSNKEVIVLSMHVGGPLNVPKFSLVVLSIKQNVQPMYNVQNPQMGGVLICQVYEVGRCCFRKYYSRQGLQNSSLWESRILM